MRPLPCPSALSLVSHAPAWTLAELSGRLVEISGGAEAASLTAAVGLVLDAQLSGDGAAWVALEGSSFFPPDVADGGVDLEALPVVRVPDARTAGRAADHLVRSGGFGLIVLDLSSHPMNFVNLSHPENPVNPPHPVNPVNPVNLVNPAILTRLLGLARTHDVAVVILTRKSRDTPSLTSLISLRAETQRTAREGRYDVQLGVLKDKRSGPGWTHVEVCRGPSGVR